MQQDEDYIDKNSLRGVTNHRILPFCQDEITYITYESKNIIKNHKNLIEEIKQKHKGYQIVLCFNDCHYYMTQKDCDEWNELSDVTFLVNGIDFPK